MALPIRTTLEDPGNLYLPDEKANRCDAQRSKTVLEASRLDGRKLSALKFWGLIEEQEEKIKITPLGREFVKNDEGRVKALRDMIKKTAPYKAIVERAAHRHEDTLNTTEVASHWHDHFNEQVADSDKILNDQAVCFFQIASGAG